MSKKEPYPQDIHERALISCDYLTDHFDPNAADYIRGRLAKLDALEEQVRIDSERMRELDSLAENHRGFLPEENYSRVFADGSASEGTPVYECPICRARSGSSEDCVVNTVRSPVVPIGIGMGQGKPLISRGTLLIHAYDRLPREFQRMFARDVGR